jgi:hypothetical protein
MNIFILDSDKQNCAKYHCDKHIVKMPLEMAQMVSFLHYDKSIYRTTDSCVMGYSKTHDKHPCTLWLKESLSNLVYGCELGIELVNEYRYRYNSVKHERSLNIFTHTLKNLPEMQDLGLTPFALAMPQEYRLTDAVESYRTYYKSEKSQFLKYSNRETPYWLLN